MNGFIAQKGNSMTFRPANPLFLLLVFIAAPAIAAEAQLQRHTVMADGHPVALWEKSPPGATESVLLVHGRTWSALPDFDLQVEDGSSH